MRPTAPSPAPAAARSRLGDSRSISTLQGGHRPLRPRGVATSSSGRTAAPRRAAAGRPPLPPRWRRVPGAVCPATPPAAGGRAGRAHARDDRARRRSRGGSSPDRASAGQRSGWGAVPRSPQHEPSPARRADARPRRSTPPSTSEPGRVGSCAGEESSRRALVQWPSGTGPTRGRSFHGRAMAVPSHRRGFDSPRPLPRDVPVMPPCSARESPLVESRRIHHRARGSQMPECLTPVAQHFAVGTSSATRGGSPSTGRAGARSPPEIDDPDDSGRSLACSPIGEGPASTPDGRSSATCRSRRPERGRRLACDEAFLGSA